jgi:hypothetical protein
MSRSVRHTPIVGNTCAASDKEAKRRANRQYRRIVRQKICEDFEVLPQIRELSNVYNFPKDGKHWCRDVTQERDR